MEDKKIIILIVFIILCVIPIVTLTTYGIKTDREQNRIYNSTSIELCGSKANTILIQELPDKMPNVTYYAICRVNDKVEIKTK